MTEAISPHSRKKQHLARFFRLVRFSRLVAAHLEENRVSVIIEYNLFLLVRAMYSETKGEKELYFGKSVPDIDFYKFLVRLLIEHSVIERDIDYY